MVRGEIPPHVPVDRLVADDQLARPPQVSGDLLGTPLLPNNSSTRAISSRPNCWLRRDSLRRATVRSCARVARYHPSYGEALRFNSRYTVLRCRPSCSAISARVSPAVRRAASALRSSALNCTYFIATLPLKFPQNRDSSLPNHTSPMSHLLCEFAGRKAPT